MAGFRPAFWEMHDFFYERDKLRHTRGRRVFRAQSPEAGTPRALAISKRVSRSAWPRSATPIKRPTAFSAR